MEFSLDDLDDSALDDLDFESNRLPYAQLVNKPNGGAAPEQNVTSPDQGQPESSQIPPFKIPSSPVNSVADFISKKNQASSPAQEPQEPIDPILAGFNQREGSLKAARNVQNQTNYISNLASAAMQAAQGSHAAQPNQDLANNIQRQGEQNVQGAAGDLDRRQAIMNQIASRNLRQTIAGANIDFRNKSLGIKQQSVDQAGAKQATAGAGKDSRLDSQNIRATNQLLRDPNLQKETTRLNAARSVGSLIDEIRNGKLISSKNVRTQLSNMISVIEQGGGGGQGDRQAMGVDNLYTEGHDFLSRLKSIPENTLNKEYLDQFGTESDTLGNRAAKNYVNLAKGIKAGADLSGGDPNKDPGQIHKLLSQRINTFMKTAGYDPETGEKIGDKSQGSQARTIITHQYSPSRNQTRITYSDGTTEVVNGQR